jgi:hypothetical protein
MLPLAVSWADVAIAAPLGFVFGVIFGLWASGRYALVDRREWDIRRRNGECGRR